MKRYILSVLLLLATCAQAQTLSVESFRLLETDLAANTHSMMRDQNGEVAALIRVVTSEKGFVFEGGMMGIVDTKQDVGEILVYVPHGIQKITIKHEQLGVLRDYFFPIPIESARTYELRLVSAISTISGQEEVAAQYVTFSVKPQDAIVTIDNTPYTLQPDGTVSIPLSYGTHLYRIESPGYVPDNGIVEVGHERVYREITLKISKGIITLVCPMQDADIILNGELIGTGSWTGELESAVYQVEVKKEGYLSLTTSFLVQAQDKKEITLPVPQPIYGTISLTTTPIGAKVYVDGVKIGVTPLVKDKVMAGKRRIEFRKTDYRSAIVEVEIKEGELNTYSMDMSNLQRKLLSKSNIYMGAHYQLGHTSGVYAFAGAYLNGFNLEGGYIIPLVTGSKIWWTVDPSAWNGQQGLEFEYSLSSIIAVNTGYGILLNKKLRLTPRVGLLINQINGKYLGSESYDNEKTFVVSGRAGICMEYSPIPHVGIVCTPAYDIPFTKGDIATQLDATSSIIKEWCNGFVLNIGLEIYF